MGIVNFNQKDLVKIALKGGKKWQSFSSDKETVELVCATVNLGIIEINNNNQFRLKSKEKATIFLNNR